MLPLLVATRWQSIKRSVANAPAAIVLTAVGGPVRKSFCQFYPLPSMLKSVARPKWKAREASPTIRPVLLLDSGVENRRRTMLFNLSCMEPSLSWPGHLL